MGGGLETLGGRYDDRAPDVEGREVGAGCDRVARDMLSIAYLRSRSVSAMRVVSNAELERI